jgi:hypothetical protein
MGPARPEWAGRRGGRGRETEVAWHLFVVFVHIMTSIVWFGYVLFWTILIGPLTNAEDESESARVLRLVNHAPWPPKQIPLPFRLTLAEVGWGLFLLLALTGSLLLRQKGITAGGLLSGAAFADRFGGILAAKFAVVAVLASMQARLTARPGRKLVYANMAGAVVVVGLSVFLAR